MGERELVIRADEVMPFSPEGQEDIYASQCIIEQDGVGSTDLVVNRFTLRARKALKGGAHAENDEAYYIIRGTARLTMRGSALGTEEERTYEVGPETAIFIPAGTFHRLDNQSDEELVLLAIWPHPPRPGTMGIFEARRKAWGTTFRKVPHADNPSENP